MLIKFAAATLELIEDARPTHQHRTAARHNFVYTARPGYIYVRCRAISSRINENYDGFSAEEIAKAYRSFIGKPVFVNHHNADITRKRGVIIDAALHPDVHADGSPDTWTELLMEIDAMRFPRLAEAIAEGDVDRTSMGTAVGFTICSYCGNKAEVPEQYCRHVASLKGQRIIRPTADGRKEAVLVYEECHNLAFFENSVLVEDPADPTAAILGVEAGPGALRAAAKTAASGKHTYTVTLPDGRKSERTTNRDYSHAVIVRRPVVSYTGDPDPDMWRTLSWHSSPEHAMKARNSGRNVWGDLKVVPVDKASARTSAKVALRFRPMDTSDDPATELEVRTAALRVEAKPRWEDPAQHPWFQQHPISSQNVIDHWNRATPEDIGQGASWYSDANLVAKAIGKGNSALGAGVLAAYSPKTLWPVNMHNAARAIELGRGIGGPGGGVRATGQMAASADAMIRGGKHHSQVLKGPKIQDFAHLIEHGGDQDPSQPHVVVDRHAMSVATGGRLTDDEQAHAPTSTRHYYNHFVNAYKDAADQLSAKLGRRIEPHQVQATTWLVRQRENAQADAAANLPLDKGREKSLQNATRTWNQYAGEHFPDLIGPGYHGASKIRKAAMRTTADLQAKPSFDPDMMMLHDPEIGQPVGRIHRYFMRDPQTGVRSNGYRFQILNNDEPGESVGSYTSEQMHPDLASALAAATQHYQQHGRGEDAPENRIAVRADEQTAPPQVDTLQPEACPVCQNVDSWSNNQCSACGYEAPPHPFDSPDMDAAQEADVHNGQPLDEEQPEPPLYMGQRTIPRNTVEGNTGMTSNTAVRANLHKRLDEQQKQINGMGGLLSAIAGRVGVTAADIPPQFQKGNDSGGSSDSSSSDSDSGPDKDSADYKSGYSDGKDGKDKSGSGTDYDAGYAAGKKAADSGSDSSDDSGDTSKESVRSRRRRAYLALKQITAESDEQAVAPDAKDDPQNIGSSPAGANTGVTPDATTSVDSAPTATTLTTDDTTKINVEAPEPGVDTPPSPDAAKDPVDIVAPAPPDNTRSFNTGDGVAWSSKGDPQTRLFAAMRLAKLQRVAGIETEDELVLAQKIVDSADPLPMIQTLSVQLDKIITAAKERQSQKSATNNLVPQNRTAGRTRPSLTAGASPTSTAGPSASSVVSDEFGDLI